MKFLLVLIGVLPTRRKYCTLSKFKLKKVEFLYAKEPTFKFWSIKLMRPIVEYQVL